MRIQYEGPRASIRVTPYGAHKKGAVKDYPDDFGEALIRTSKRQKFSRVDAKLSATKPRKAKKK